MEIVNVQPYSISPLSIIIHATALFCFSVRVTVIQFRFFFVTRRGVLLLCARTLFISLFFFWALTFLAERVSLWRYTSHCAFGWHNEQTCITFFFVCVFSACYLFWHSRTRLLLLLCSEYNAKSPRKVSLQHVLFHSLRAVEGYFTVPPEPFLFDCPCCNVCLCSLS